MYELAIHSPVSSPYLIPWVTRSSRHFGRLLRPNFVFCTNNGLSVHCSERFYPAKYISNRYLFWHAWYICPSLKFGIFSPALSTYFVTVCPLFVIFLSAYEQRTERNGQVLSWYTVTRKSCKKTTQEEISVAQFVSEHNKTPSTTLD